MTDSGTQAAVAEPGERPMRADAVRNRERVIAAAAAVFAEHGVEAGVPEIAERAGVGKGTVYRNFPTKEHLIAAIVVMRINAFENDITEALENEDAFEGFRAALARAATAKVCDHSFADAISTSSELEGMPEARESLIVVLDQLMDKAKKQGRMRPDASATDVRVLFGGGTRLLAADGNTDPEAWQRLGHLVADALKLRPDS